MPVRNSRSKVGPIIIKGPLTLIGAKMTEETKGILAKLRSLIPIHELELDAQNQVYEALRLEFLLLLALMPDCHTGYSLPIGGVALLDSVISPGYVGYDIGCGMCYIVTKILAKDFFKRKGKALKIFEQIYKEIPVGFDSRDKGLEYYDFKSASGDKQLDERVASRIFIQLGTLGGGNHFIEIGENLEGFLAITIHSGSRNIGHSIASVHMEVSKLVDVDLPKGFLHLRSGYGQEYLKDMNFALEYALENRKVMMRTVLFILGFSSSEVDDLIKNHMVNENHNHAIVQDDGSVLHRKGATPADKEQIGIIPGNMKDGVYVTEGLGNEEYLSSSSHGAGRKMSRGKAKKSINMERFRGQMSGIVAKIAHETKDEAPDAYKNVHDVIKKQEGVVIKTIDYVKPLINIKG
jgi:tRNA-splicing ligase RtcB (3'-phosphate/5'-hydroxy nucleic acid ligase)